MIRYFIVSTTTPPLRARVMAQWPESLHLSLSRRQNLSLHPTLVVKMQRPENRYVGLKEKNDVSTNFVSNNKMVLYVFIY